MIENNYVRHRVTGQVLQLVHSTPEHNIYGREMWQVYQHPGETILHGFTSEEDMLKEFRYLTKLEQYIFLWRRDEHN